MMTANLLSGRSHQTRFADNLSKLNFRGSFQTERGGRLGNKQQQNFINKQMIWQKHYPQLARLFVAGQCMRKKKWRQRLTKGSLQFTNKWNKNRNVVEDLITQLNNNL